MNTTEVEAVEERLSAPELWESWAVLSEEEKIEGFRMLRRPEREDFFLELPSRDQATLVERLPPEQRRSWLRLLAPDDAADVIQHVPPEERDGWLALLDQVTRRDVSALLAYAEDDAGGLMSPRFARVRPDMSVDEAITYLRKQARQRVETIYYAYVLGPDQRLLGVVSFRDLFTARPEQRVDDVMIRDLVVARDTMDQEEMSRLFAQHDLIAIPVVDDEGRMKGLVTVDDIVDVVQEEATEDIQRLGGSEALDAPYLVVTLPHMIRKRAIWLAVLFLGEMLTATAMGHFEEEIAKAVVLALFVPLIISSGGNSGSQATTLVIRAMALGEVKLRDWWRVARREVVAGLALGVILGAIGVMRILVWHELFGMYGDHAIAVALTVGLSLVGVVLWGCLAGSMLPFVLRRVGLDPASASAPFVATLVDVSGLVIYFSVASFVLGGRLL
ncbi:MAG TPA: magnesium transporter [Anaeromyxobacteraceae bacterium]|nr:magnesium transporter [Anaeromyxobacteraceae bacterium]